MNSTQHPLRALLAGTAGFAVIWVIAAAISPTTTFHLAPVIVSAWPAVAVRRRADGPAASLTGLVVAVAVTLGLSLAGLLRGPSLLTSVGPAAESAIGAALGTLVGLVVMRLRTRVPAQA